MSNVVDNVIRQNIHTYISVKVFPTILVLREVWPILGTLVGVDLALSFWSSMLHLSEEHESDLELRGWCRRIR